MNPRKSAEPTRDLARKKYMYDKGGLKTTKSKESPPHFLGKRGKPQKCLFSKPHDSIKGKAKSLKPENWIRGLSYDVGRFWAKPIGTHIARVGLLI